MDQIYLNKNTAFLKSYHSTMGNVLDTIRSPDYQQEKVTYCPRSGVTSTASIGETPHDSSSDSDEELNNRDDSTVTGSNLVLLTTLLDNLSKLPDGLLPDEAVNGFTQILHECRIKLRHALDDIDPVKLLVDRYSDLRKKGVPVKTAVLSSMELSKHVKPNSTFFNVGTNWTCSVSFLNNDSKILQFDATSTNKSNAEAMAYVKLMGKLGAREEEGNEEHNWLDLVALRPYVFKFLDNQVGIPENYVIRRALRSQNLKFRKETLNALIREYRSKRKI
jgi:hypothetical protein